MESNVQECDWVERSQWISAKARYSELPTPCYRTLPRFSSQVAVRNQFVVNLYPLHKSHGFVIQYYYLSFIWGKVLPTITGLFSGVTKSDCIDFLYFRLLYPSFSTETSRRFPRSTCAERKLYQSVLHAGTCVWVRWTINLTLTE